MATPHTFQSAGQSAARSAGEFSANEQAALVAFGVVLVALWLLPTIVAARRRVPDVGSIAVVNVLLGWFPLWWVTTLARACQRVPRPPATATQHAGGAGWWPDPINPRRLRYHDGEVWTDFVHVAQR